MTDVRVTPPSAAGWSPKDFLAEVIGRVGDELCVTPGVRFAASVGPGWAWYLDREKQPGCPGVTLRDRLLLCSAVASVRVDAALPRHAVRLQPEGASGG